MQSVSLRAALLRGLENAKKSGALGRDAIIRKTMLDDCKGDRLEELLATFSTAVVKKVLVDSLAAAGESTPLAVELALENRGYMGEGTLLRPLIIAHRSSLARSLERRAEAAAKYRDFADLLSIKERNITRRREALRSRQEAGGESAGSASDDDRWRVRRAVRNNWSGSEAWMDTLFTGDASAKDTKGLLAAPYDRVWRRVQQGRLAELEEDSRGLLEQLDGRVAAQKHRLAKWHALRKEMATGHVPVSPRKRQEAEKTKQRGIDLQFNAHKDLQVAGAAQEYASGTESRELHEDYTEIVRGLEMQLSKIHTTDCADILRKLADRNAQGVQFSSTQYDPGEAVSDMSELEEDNNEQEPVQQPVMPPQVSASTAKRLPSRPASSSLQRPRSLIRPPSTSSRAPNRTGSSSSQSNTPHLSEDGNSTEPSRRPSRQVGNAQPTNNDIQSTHNFDGSDGGSGSGSGSSSPTKRSKPRHTLSLAERTRLSMVRDSSRFLEDDDEADPVLAPASSNRAPPPSHQSLEDVAEDDDLDDLASRTRKSMVGFEKAKQKAQVERRRSLRRSKVLPRREGSLFPAVEEEGPGTPVDQTARIEALMAEDNVDAIFGKRKGRISPLPSPTKEWDD